MYFFRVQPGDRVQQHNPVFGQRAMRHGEERIVALMTEMLEGADADDPVDGLVELLPSLQQNPLGAGAFGLRDQLLDVLGLVLAQRETDNVDVVLFHRAHHGGAPAAADVEQCHARL